MKIEFLEDGVWEINSEKDILLKGHTETDNPNELKVSLRKFYGKRYDKVYVGMAYQCPYAVVLLKKPKKLCDWTMHNQSMITGSGFNYGCTNLIMPHKKILLILAEDD